VDCSDDNDQNVIMLWLAQRPPTTTRLYRLSLRHLQRATPGVELRDIRLPHLQAFAQSLRGMKLSSQGTVVGAIQSLFAFACKINYLPTNPAVLLKRPGHQRNVAERIVGEADIRRLIALTTNPREAVLLRLAYVSGLRIAELSALRWRHLGPRESGAVLSVIGKGTRLRHIFLPEHMWTALNALRDGASDDAPVFLSRERKPLAKQTMHTIVKQAARRAGLPPTFSMHWCRHAHASHAMDHGAPIHLVQQTLGHASLATTARYVHCKPGTSSAEFIPDRGELPTRRMAPCRTPAGVRHADHPPAAEGGAHH
jgi:integrase/recombinase XerD